MAGRTAEFGLVAVDVRRFLATTTTMIMVAPTTAAMMTISNVFDTPLSSLPDAAESDESSGLDADVVPGDVVPELGGTDTNSAMTAP